MIGGIYLKKRVISIVMILVLALCILPLNAAAGTLSNFLKSKTYATGQFSDVSNQWFAPFVQTSFEYSLMEGTSPTTFSPEKNLTIGEAVKLAACLHSVYNTGTTSFAKGITPWYQPYVDYALSNGIIQANYSNYTAYATRSDMAVIFARALPAEAMTPINKIDDNTIPDVSNSYTYGAAVYTLYRAGILSGSGDNHAYNPNNNITRAEVATIVAHMAGVNRTSFTISSTELSKTEIAAKCSPAVFYIEVYDQKGAILGSASGFFISSSGLAVTNYHVIDGASSAKITTKDLKTYVVAGVYDYSITNDLALLQINGSGFPFLATGDSTALQTGADIFAIGYPRGIDQTFTDGTVTNAAHILGGVSVILNNAQISPGSSGGALVNTKGQVIGVTSGSYTETQNVNYAVPIHLTQGMKQTNYVPLSSIAQTPKLTVTAAPTTVSVAKGAQTTLTATASSDNFDSISYVVEDKSIVSCSWGSWNGNSIPLMMTGLKAGTTTLYIGLLDASDNMLAETSVSVTVIGSGSTTVGYYAGYYPIPDFGSFTGTPLYDSWYDPSTDGMGYYYENDLIPMNPVDYVTGYANLLTNAGCVYSDSFTNDDGFTVLVYEYGPSNLNIMYGLTYNNGVYYMMILIIPID